jgi:3-phosphoshikimate 1-carboxyvinyltransferase
MKIKPARRVRGSIKMPGDKSISHRAAMIAALAEGATTIRNFSTSADCAATLRCLENLGVEIERSADAVRVCGVGLKNGLRAPLVPLDCANSGSTMRMLVGILAGQNFAATLIGDESLSKRPMRRIIAPLEKMGARISSNDELPPLIIEGKNPLKAIRYETPVASAQVKSCVLLAGLFAEGRTEVIERTKTRDHTERMLRWFGVKVDEREEVSNDATKHLASIAPPFELKARDFSVPGDVSSATFFVAAAALLPDSNLTIENVGLNATRAQILRTMRDLGARIEIANAREESNEPTGDIEIRADGFLSTERPILRGATIANLIDELPMLAVVGTQLPNGLEIRDASELRVKESDRIRAVVRNLRAMRAEVEEHADGMTIAGGQRLRGARLESFGDHRIAMAFAIAALIAEGESEIVGADCVAVSFPNFFELLESIIEKVPSSKSQVPSQGLESKNCSLEEQSKAKDQRPKIKDPNTNRKSKIENPKSTDLELVSNSQSAIVITGFMGAGKTSAARALARRLECAMIDLDEFITKQTGRTPQEIIDREGEAQFREIETRALDEALRVCEESQGERRISLSQIDDENAANAVDENLTNLVEEDSTNAVDENSTSAVDENLTNKTLARVVALGGGAWTLERNRRLINERGCLTVWLDAPFEVCWQRIRREDSSLRLRPFARHRAAAQALYEERKKSYAFAAHRVKVAGTESAEELAARILEFSRLCDAEEKKPAP